MKLNELCKSILSRENVDYLSLKEDSRIAIVDSNKLDIMKIDRVGYGRPISDIELEQADDAYNLTTSLELIKEIRPMNYIAIAKICPGQSSMILLADKYSLDKNELQDAISKEFSAWKGDVELIKYLGILGNYLKAHWHEVNKEALIKKITKSEMKFLEEECYWQLLEDGLKKNQYYDPVNFYPE